MRDPVCNRYRMERGGNGKEGTKEIKRVKKKEEFEKVHEGKPEPDHEFLEIHHCCFNRPIHHHAQGSQKHLSALQVVRRTPPPRPRRPERP